MANKFDGPYDERSPERTSDLEARLDDLGKDPGQVGDQSGGQSGDTQGLSDLEGASDESVEELAAEEQSLEAARLEGIDDAADHPERPVHTHDEYGRSDDLPSTTRDDAA